MKIAAACFAIMIASIPAHAADKPRQVPEPKPLPTMLDSDFQFRKTKLFTLTAIDPLRTVKVRNITGTNNKIGSGADASLSFERAYRLHGAVTGFDQRQRYGEYFDFFWRAKREADVTVRLEYRQEKLRSFVQAREAVYPHARGTHKTEFAITGDDFSDDGRIIAWRCLLIESGRIVAINRSFLWE